MKHIRQHVAKQKVVWVNKTAVTTFTFAESCVQGRHIETLVTSTCVSVDCLKLKTYHMSSKSLHNE
jgi:hypothetical protein